MTDSRSNPETASWRPLLQELFERHRAAHDTDMDVARKLAPMLSEAAGREWSADYPHQVYRRNIKPSRQFIRAVDKVASEYNPRQRKPHVYVPVPDEETRDRIHRNIPADERYWVLDVLAAHEEAA